jgi:hypothetical protein
VSGSGIVAAWVSITEFIRVLRGSLWVTFEEGTSAAWLYDLLKPHVEKVVVCAPRKNLSERTKTTAWQCRAVASRQAIPSLRICAIQDAMF